MSIYGLFVTYLIVWWLILFMVLPFGITSQAENGNVIHGSDRESPARPQLLKKFLITTVIAFFVWSILCLTFTQGWLTLDDQNFYDMKQ